MHDGRPDDLALGERADLGIVLAHGRGGSPGDMRALAEALALDNVRFVFLRADGGVWYPKSFMAPVADNQPWLDAALAHYERAVAGLVSDGIDETRIVVGGFSQGACLTCEYLARYPRHYAAALIFTGGLIGPAGVRYPLHDELAGMPAYAASSEIDEWIPPERARQTVEWLRACGAAVKADMFENRPHRVSDEEIAAARQVLQRARRAPQAEKPL